MADIEVEVYIAVEDVAKWIAENTSTCVWDYDGEGEFGVDGYLTDIIDAVRATAHVSVDTPVRELEVIRDV